jgi:hypothetical protein
MILNHWKMAFYLFKFGMLFIYKSYAVLLSVLLLISACLGKLHTTLDDSKFEVAILVFIVWTLILLIIKTRRLEK